METKSINTSDIILAPASIPAPWNWEAVFGNSKPVEIEIGFGKGGFLVQSCQSFPGKNFLGIETALKMVHYTAERLAKRNLQNVRVLQSDAHYVFSRFMGDRSARAVHVYFPDPWPKKRHRKRRLLQPAFLEQLTRVIKPGGNLYFATDFQDYFEQTMELFKGFPAFICKDPTSWVESRPSQAITNYEVKYRHEGRPIYYALFERAGS